MAEAGVYLTRIVDRKESQGETFLVTDGGLNHQLAASGNFPVLILSLLWSGCTTRVR